MLRPGLRDDFIVWALWRNSLQNFLKLSFRINLQRLLRKTLNILLGLLEYKAANNLDIAIQIYRTHQCLVRISQNRSPLAPPARFFTPSHHEISAQPDIDRVDLQTLARNKP